MANRPDSAEAGAAPDPPGRASAVRPVPPGALAEGPVPLAAVPGVPAGARPARLTEDDGVITRGPAGLLPPASPVRKATEGEGAGAARARRDAALSLDTEPGRLKPREVHPVPGVRGAAPPPRGVPTGLSPVGKCPSDSSRAAAHAGSRPDAARSAAAMAGVVAISPFGVPTSPRPASPRATAPRSRAAVERGVDWSGVVGEGAETRTAREAIEKSLAIPTRSRRPRSWFEIPAARGNHRAAQTGGYVLGGSSGRVAKHSAAPQLADTSRFRGRHGMNLFSYLDVREGALCRAICVVGFVSAKGGRRVAPPPLLRSRS